MKLNRPLWMSGALLTPQPFQQQAAWEAYTNERIARLATVQPWGIDAVAVDAQALRLGKLQLSRLCLRLPDGTLLDSADADRLPAAIDLAGTIGADPSPAVYVLALALEQGNGGNCLMEGQMSPGPVRYRQAWQEVQDAYAHAGHAMAVLEPVLVLRPATDDNAGFVTCPVVRLEHDGQGSWSVDPHFIPPLLSVQAHAGLLDSLHHLMTQLSAKRSRLMAMRRESNQRMADFAVADVSLFWLLNALNTYQPVLADFLAHPSRHPEPVYLALVQLAGSLLTFSLEHDLSDIPPYRHDDLEQVFPPLMKLIATLLESSLPSRVLALALDRTVANRWQVALRDPRLRELEGTDFYLSVRSGLPAAQVQAQLPRLCKVGAPDDVDRLINAALDGIALVSLAHVPAAIPMRLGNQYFALDLSGPPGQAMLAAGVCAFYVPTTLADLELELYAVLRS
ncbi:type VI secretion system baseplate subunit TssK [Pseudomonas sp. dw_358]|uniref:type VI secretion system baseplate subunit TssK n=1 Tax=Pseudomonas sp. dw_358 TaxID=2720083 RepID=UPI001BD68EF8|nr:type VI secretion system baseplate subunit TssK [Pseudomonas sp. dw_358]